MLGFRYRPPPPHSNAIHGIQMPSTTFDGILRVHVKA